MHHLLEINRALTPLGFSITIVGDFFLCGMNPDGEDFDSLSDSLIDKIKNILI